MTGHAKIETVVVYTQVPSEARRRAVMVARLTLVALWQERKPCPANKFHYGNAVDSGGSAVVLCS